MPPAFREAERQKGSPSRCIPCILVHVHRAVEQPPVECAENPSLLGIGSVNNLFVIYK